MRIELGLRGREQELAAGSFEQFAIALEGARVGIEIFAGRELQPVYEDAADHGGRGLGRELSSDRWPSCRLPMVGTKDARSVPASARRSSAMDRTMRKSETLGSGNGGSGASAHCTRCTTTQPIE